MSELETALRERDAYFAEAARAKDTLATVIPALELSSGLKASDFQGLSRENGLTPDELSALWMARAILEAR